MENYCKYIKMLVSFRLSWRKRAMLLWLHLFITKIDTLINFWTTGELRLWWCLFIVKRYILKKLQLSDKLGLRWQFSLIKNSPGNGKSIFFSEKYCKKSWRNYRRKFIKYKHISIIFLVFISKLIVWAIWVYNPQLQHACFLEFLSSRYRCLHSKQLWLFY